MVLSTRRAERSSKMDPDEKSNIYIFTFHVDFVTMIQIKQVHMCVHCLYDLF